MVLEETGEEPLMLISAYISTLIDNVDTKKLPREIDVAFDSGAFNGAYGLGVALYISKLEAHTHLVVRRTSGASVGALIALMYLVDLNRWFEQPYMDLRKQFQRTGRLQHVRYWIHDYVVNWATDADIERLQGRLYISYHDAISGQRITVSRYTSRKHLIDCIERSAYLPKITADDIKLSGRYVDGVYPHLFETSARPTLFVRLLAPSIIANALSSRGEKNTQSRVLEGVVAAHRFFVTGESPLCVYTSEMGLVAEAGLRVRLYLMIAVFGVICVLSCAAGCLPAPVRTSQLYTQLARCAADMRTSIGSLLVH